MLNEQPLSGVVECTFYHLPVAVPSQAVPAELTFEQGATSSDEAEAHIHSPHLPSHVEFLLFQEGFVPEEVSESSGIKSTLPASLPLCIQEAAGTVLMMMFLALVGAPSPVPSPVRKQEKELVQAELLATLNHELRSPLAAIKGYVEILLRHEQRIQPEERHEFLLAIDDASTRLTKRIHNLLELSQLEAGIALFEFSSVNVAVLARESFLTAKVRWEQENTSSSQEGDFSLSLEDEDGSPTLDEPVIQADRQRLREMLEHLLHNALQYSPQGGEIEVLLRPVPLSELRAMQEEKSQFRQTWSEGETVPPMLEIRVRDHGIGIPHSHQQSIFDRFRQVDMSLIREVNGLGLGLSICKHIVDLHKGSLWVASEVGKGSTFHIWLPIRKAV
ncbi:cell wall metabolism sensor histidine kinase WalK [Ktedonobacter sp. SOSP1-85]|uniref:sensor histidine kinase n=1 Tax=Ktedonobacter sp. SOSP1-85 TaxID=2778367 RepID=UPI001915FD63|nr:HAMP domain-containing sensor histidine kinase [Ktedonobacter sp. SOSP1-85]